MTESGVYQISALDGLVVAVLVLFLGMALTRRFDAL
jgi:hypothetical protein